MGIFGMVMSDKFSLDTASSVARVNKVRIQELGRGSCSKNVLQSPTSVSVSSVDEPGVNAPGASGQPSVETNIFNAYVAVSGTTKGTGSSPVGAFGFSKRHTEVGMSGARGLTKNQRRKLRKKALQAANMTGGSDVGVKRPRPDGSTPSPNVCPPIKKPREDIQPRMGVQSRMEVQLREDDCSEEDDQTGKIQPGSYSHGVKTTKIDIVKRGFPSDRLSVEESESILMKILELTDSIPDGEKMPNIYSNNVLKGALILQCGSDTLDWIRASFDGKVLGDLALKVLSADELPKPVKVTFKTKEKFSQQDVLLRRLQRVNPELKSMGWRVLQSVVGPGTSRWIFEVDPEDVDAIRRADFGDFTGVDGGIFKIIHDPNRKKPVVKDSTEVLLRLEHL